MEFVTLPELETPVSRVALGGCPLGGHGWGHVDDADSIAAVRCAAEAGVNFFDTADVYGLGHSEELLAEALGARRQQCVIATKFGVRRTADGRTLKDASPIWMEQALEASLKRLKLERIPLYYLHWPDWHTPIEETVGALERCRREGKIGAIGLSNVSPEELDRACSVARISAVQVQYSLVDRQPAAELDAVIRKWNIPLATWGSLAQGLLTGKYDAGARFAPDDRRSRYENFQGAKFESNLRMVDLLKSLAAQLDRKPGQIAMRWLLQTPHVACVLFGAKTPAQVQENLGAVDWALAPNLMAALTVGPAVPELATSV
jgi:aryl-alcohol dehydrogenase-like predicted oxidoreductase